MNSTIDISRVIARQAIDLALNDYTIGIDDRDAARWLNAFHVDAVFDVDFPRAVLKGHEAILAWAREAWLFQTISHLTGNHRIEFVDNTHATGIGRGLGIFKLEDGTTVLATARLDDQYESRSGAWKIASRKVFLISSFALRDATPLILNGVEVNRDSTKGG